MLPEMTLDDWRELISTTLGVEIPSHWMVVLLLVFATLVPLVRLIHRRLGARRLWRKKKMDVVSKTDFKGYVRFIRRGLYIPAKFQSKTPSDYPDPNDATIAEAREDLFQKLLECIDDKGSEDSLFCILGGAGMGKSSFMVYLYRKLVNRLDGEERDVVFLSLMQDDVIESIRGIENKRDTILLLDALDENAEAINHFETFWSCLINAVKEFSHVVISCRTQFFSSSDEEPNYTTLKSCSSNKGMKHFIRYYISPLSQEERITYIKKRYPWYSFRLAKRKRALKVVELNFSLMSRPLLIANIDALINTQTEFEFSFQIYDALIEEWASREARRQGLHGEQASKFVAQIFEISEAASRVFYEKRANKSPVHLTPSELAQFQKSHPLENGKLEINSLFNRDVKGNWKFAHKSFFEHFLSKVAFDSFEAVPDLETLDIAWNFYRERCMVECEQLLGEDRFISLKDKKMIVVRELPPEFKIHHLAVYINERKFPVVGIINNVLSQRLSAQEFWKSLLKSDIECIYIKDDALVELPTSILFMKSLWKIAVSNNLQLTSAFRKTMGITGFIEISSKDSCILCKNIDRSSVTDIVIKYNAIRVVDMAVKIEEMESDD